MQLIGGLITSSGNRTGKRQKKKELTAIYEKLRHSLEIYFPSNKKKNVGQIFVRSFVFCKSMLQINKEKLPQGKRCVGKKVEKKN